MSYDDDFYDHEADDDFDADIDAPEQRRTLIRGRGQPPEAEELLRRVADLIAAARPMPLSASAMINKEEVLELLDEAILRLPDELREARWLRKEREEYLAKMRADGDEITEAARARAEQMVQRTEVVKAAEHRARRIIEGAEAEARRLRLECEDFCDHRLASFEVVLERTLKLVASGRDKLQATNLAPAPAEAEVEEQDETFFDQDRS
jgi:cell division septum initiation protein DivIVA